MKIQKIQNTKYKMQNTKYKVQNKNEIQNTLKLICYDGNFKWFWQVDLGVYKGRACVVVNVASK